MKFFTSLKTTFTAFIVVMVILVFAVQTGISTYHYKSTLDTSMEQELKFRAEKEAGALYTQLSNISKTATVLANDIEAMPQYDTDLLLTIAKQYMQAEPLIVGGGFWMEPYSYKPDAKYFGPYIGKDASNQLKVSWEYSTPESDYFKEPWYKLGISGKSKVMWSQPYEDTVTNVPMITAISQINKQGKIIGVTTFDVGLKELQDYVAGMKVGKNGYAFIISQEGYYLGHKISEKNLKQKISEESDSKLREIGGKIIAANETALDRISINDNDSFTVYTPIGSTGMKLVLVMPSAEVYSALYKVMAINLITFIAAIFLFVILIFYIFTRTISKPINQLVGVAEKIANGDLSGKVAITSKNEIGVLAKSIQTMVNNLREVVFNVMQSAEQVAASSQQLMANADQSAQATEQVTAVITDVANNADKQLTATNTSLDAIKNMSANIEQIAINANTVVTMSNQTAAAAGKGGSAIETAVNQMNHIDTTVVQSAEVITHLDECSRQIGQIVDTISGIANQTNLLALNAAIEAARAGEHGKGFAVVADEVRKLAEQSQAATEQIAALIAEIQGKTNKAVTAMQEGISEVKLGTEVVSTAGMAFSEIVSLVNEVSPKIQEISSAMQQMTAGSQQMVHSVHEIDDLSRNVADNTQTVSAATQEQSAAMEEIASSSNALAKLAEELRVCVNKFKI